MKTFTYLSLTLVLAGAASASPQVTTAASATTSLGSGLISYVLVIYCLLKHILTPVLDRLALVLSLP
jgi:hypothetical protein